MEILQPAIRPNYCQLGTPIPLYGNFFKFNLAAGTDIIQKYAVFFNPDIAASLGKHREKVLRKASAQIVPVIGKYVFANTAIYAAQSNSGGGDASQTYTVNYDNTDYTITLQPVGRVESQEETRHFYNKFFNSVQGKLSLVMIGRKFYNPDRAIDLPQHKMSIWPGYASSIGSYEGGVMINIDISHRCLRTITLYDQIMELRNKPNTDFRQAVMKLLIGAIVLTLYNKKNYRIDDIDWDSSPLSTFADKAGGQCSYKEYYERRWQKPIAHDDQPLLLSKTKTLDCYLIPEFCVMTGLTDEIRADFNIMKDMANATKKEPQSRLQESGGLIKALKDNPRTNAEINEWRVNITPDPAGFDGYVLPAGNIMMGGGNSFKINEQNGSFDRDVQNTMFQQPPLDRWGIFYCENDKRLIDQFMTVMQQVIGTYKVNCQKPAMFGVKSDRWNDWDQKLKESLNPQVQMIVCVLPGQRGKSRLYDDLKRLTFSQLPVPSQCILNGTLKKDKGLRSVVNKVMMQINAKAGGIPWAMQGLPLTDQPTMIVGIDVFTKRGSHSVLGFCATTDSNFGRYVSCPKVNNPGEEPAAKIAECTYQALSQFKAENGIFPRRVCVFRDGVSDSQIKVLLNGEIPQMKQAFKRLKDENPQMDEPKLIFIVVNKRINARFYHNQGGRINNPPLGTCIDRMVIDKSGYDFYVMPAKATQGAMTPTYFTVVYDNSGARAEEVEQLAYRLCYSYYNWSGSIRVPAPCQYAHKLAYQYGERANQQGPPIPHQHWQNTRSLYFL
ncbi:unnamed protein product [Blepharisma stoltei]|uniref:Piwi n=1 Tax=Blepharisma stoltei TaxID=1481888 RepID=A0AAU9IJR5_9CILI|nr:unnamed protein product [Blepharisma stoltei]